MAANSLTSTLLIVLKCFKMGWKGTGRDEDGWFSRETIDNDLTPFLDL